MSRWFDDIVGLMFPFLTVLVTLLLLTSVYAAELPGGFEEDLVVYGLNQPLAAEYARDGRLFILEKQGKIRIFTEGKLLKPPFLKVKVNSIRTWAARDCV